LEAFFPAGSLIEAQFSKGLLAMFDSALTLIAATNGDTLIEPAANAIHDALASLGAQVSQPDWLAPQKACDLLFSGIAIDRAEARTRTLLAERFADAKLDLIVQEVANRRKRLVAADLESTLIARWVMPSLELALLLPLSIATAWSYWRDKEGRSC
jgi:phosphoserine phosphatase